MRGSLFSAVVCVFAGVSFASVHARDYFVSRAGSDDAAGTKGEPLRTIQKAADVMVAGDTCYVRGGVYRETVTPKRAGKKGRPIRFVACPGELVTLSGTEPIACEWRVGEGSIYCAEVDREFEQLFVDGEMMVEARWPNMRFPDELWDRSKWMQAGEGSAYGRVSDPELAKTGVDWTGAMATLNVAHQFYTWTRVVRDHEAGRDFFEYDQDLGKDIPIRYGDKTRMWEDDRYFLSGKLEALDMATEWFLDPESQRLHLWAPGGGDPSGRRIEVKARDFAFRVESLDYIELEGFHFFGATFLFEDCDDCVVDDCHLRFPDYTRELTDLAPKPSPVIGTGMRGNGNTFRNSSLAYTPTGGIVMTGRQSVVENCVIHDVCWNGSLRYVAINTSSPRNGEGAPGGVVRRNSVFNCGNAIINYRSQPYVIELNHVYDGGLLCEDVALIYTGSPYCAGCVVRYNWAHGCRTERGEGLGIRGDDQTRELTVHHNVVWDCGRDGIIIKGDHNKAVNNTVLYIGTKGRLGNFIDLPTRPEPVKAWRNQHPLLEVQNAHSWIFNNAARTITCDTHLTPFPESENLAHNYRGDDLMLADVAQWDFRPAEGSPLIDAGREVSGLTGEFEGAAPDAGAYEFGGENWRPGHRNGLRILRGQSSGAGAEPRAALLMPVLEPVEVKLEPGNGSLRFTPGNWMRPQVIEGGLKGGGPLHLRTEEWGSVSVSPDEDLFPARAGPSACKIWFERSDIGTATAPDTRFLTDYFPPRPGPHRRAVPTTRAFRIEKPLLIDGRIASDEWPGWGEDRVLRLRARHHGREGGKGSRGEAHVLMDDENLYIGTRVLRDVEEVRIDYQAVGGGKTGPAFFVRGLSSGGMDAGYEAGGAKEDGVAWGKAAAFAASAAGEQWEGEFRISLKALGRPRDAIEKLRFDVCGMAGQGQCTWAVAGETGELFLDPSPSATGVNLLVGGGFEIGDMTAWKRASNAGRGDGSITIDRVREGADGGWCVRIENHDAEVMATAVHKWIQYLPATLDAGTYVLSYDMRVKDLEARGSQGSFNAYIRTGVADGGGENEGQWENAYIGSDLGWTRRSQAIVVPEGAKPRYVSLQLHRATGIVWVDNVSLIRCD